MVCPSFNVRSIGAQAEPLAVIDDFAPDPGALRAAAFASRFEAAPHHYPGIRASLPTDYWPTLGPVVAAAISAAFGGVGPPRLIDASFAMVTRRPDALTAHQRLPHCDAHTRDRIAMVHYLVPAGTDGTAFFRHRATGLETIDEEQLGLYRDTVALELRSRPRPDGYAVGDGPLFVRTGIIEGVFNRAILYRSAMLHSGAISPGAGLSTDPRVGRLTVTAFLSMA